MNYFDIGAPRVSLTEQFRDRFEQVTLTVIYYWPLHHYLAWFYKRVKHGSYLVLAISPFLVAKLFGRESGVTRLPPAQFTFKPAPFIALKCAGSVVGHGPFFDVTQKASYVSGDHVPGKLQRKGLRSASQTVQLPNSVGFQCNTLTRQGANIIYKHEGSITMIVC